MVVIVVAMRLVLQVCGPVTTRIRGSWLRSISFSIYVCSIDNAGNSNAQYTDVEYRVRPRTWSPLEIHIGYVQSMPRGTSAVSVMMEVLAAAMHPMS